MHQCLTFGDRELTGLNEDIAHFKLLVNVPSESFSISVLLFQQNVQLSFPAVVHALSTNSASASVKTTCQSVSIPCFVTRGASASVKTTCVSVLCFVTRGASASVKTTCQSVSMLCFVTRGASASVKTTCQSVSMLCFVTRGASASVKTTCQSVSRCNRVYCIHVPGHDPITFSFRSFSFLIGWGFYGPII